MEQQIANLPPLAMVVFGAVLAVIFGVRYLGLWQGRQSSPSANTSSAQVAAVIVDPTALNRVSDETAKLTEAVNQLVDVGERMARSEEHMAIELDRIREELRIQREVERRRGG